ncbi:hypothetical protein PHMEG_00011989 [Phytophthora megakarya]|uniref:Uncharacterized protein n=1 Tax=Phytophthora megakarya TaxID=4795 RepID=A0A225WBK5_9STRA|nr:hypothetical protein PHMEG_00011989 [Phytophthora megakarya]
MEVHKDPPAAWPPRVPPDPSDAKGDADGQNENGSGSSSTGPEMKPIAARTKAKTDEGDTTVKTDKQEKTEDAETAKASGKQAQKEVTSWEDEEGGKEPPQWDDMEMEPLSFAEMHAYLVDQLRGVPLDQAREVNGLEEFLQTMFDEEFEDHPAGFLPPGRRRYPMLDEDEMELMIQLFCKDVRAGQIEARNGE